MSGSAELLVLRLALLAVIFAFVAVAAFTLRRGLAPRPASPAVRPAVRSPRLILVLPGQTGLVAGEVFPVAGQMVIGRDPESGIVLHDPSVSGRHAALTRTAGGWELADLGSTNGTFVNGRPLDGRASLLRGGEEVAFGAVVLRFQP